MNAYFYQRCFHFEVLDVTPDESKTKSFFQLVILGVEGSGKTTFVQQLKNINKSNLAASTIPTKPTMGMDVNVEDIAGIKSFIYDLGGQQQFEHVYWEPLTKKADAIIYVIDVSMPSSFARVKEHLSFISKIAAQQNVPLLILANKRDKKEAVPFEQAREDLNINQMTTNYPDLKYEMFSTNAKTGHNIAKAMSWLVDALLSIHKITMTKKIYEVYIYHREIGLPLSYLFPLNETETERKHLETRAALISGFNTALGSFSEELFSNTSNYNILHIKDPNNDEKNLKVVNYKCMEAPLNCIIIADGAADDEILKTLAQNIVIQFTKEINWREMISFGIINPLDIRPLVLRELQDENLTKVMEISSRPLQPFQITDDENNRDKIKNMNPRLLEEEMEASTPLTTHETTENLMNRSIDLPLKDLPDLSELESDPQIEQLGDNKHENHINSPEITTNQERQGIPLKEETTDQQETMMDNQHEDDFFESFQKLSVLERVKLIEQKRRRKERGIDTR